MNNYTKPELEIIELSDATDTICTSGLSGGPQVPGGENPETPDDSW